jgi:hypothetical protein
MSSLEEAIMDQGRTLNERIVKEVAVQHPGHPEPGFLPSEHTRNDASTRKLDIEMAIEWAHLGGD